MMLGSRSLARCILLAALAAATPLTAQTPATLHAGDAPVAAEIAAEQTHTYALDLAAGQFVRGAADQQTVDLVVRVVDPAGAVIGSFDSPARGREPFQFTTRTAGVHRVEVAPFEGGAGRYAIALERVEPLAPTPQGRTDQRLSAYDRPDSPGAVVGVVRNGELVWVKGYGMANMEYDVPNTAGTVFHMASVSKQFAAFAVALLAQQGKLSLDDDIREHLDDVPDFGTPITVRQLIHHTSGLRDQWSLWSMAGGRMDDVITQENLLALVRRQTELNFAPGSEHLYSNTGYSLLAEIVERVSGQDFGEWLDANVFAPLGMEDTQIYDDHERIVKQRAYSYRTDRERGYRKAVLSYANQGATSLFTTAGDLARWLGNFHTAQVGGPALIEQMQQRGVLSNGDTIAYAFGITVGEHRGLRRLQHGGADAGYRTMLAYYPELDAGVVVLSNLATFNVGETARELAEDFFGDRMQPAEVETPATLRPNGSVDAPAEPWTPTVAELEPYAGRYYSPELETFYTLAVEDGGLVARHRRHGAIALSPVEEDAFQGSQWFFGSVRFERGTGGELSGMRVSNGRVRNLWFARQD